MQQQRIESLVTAMGCSLRTTDWHCFSKAVVSVLATNKVVADLRRNALHVVRQVAESGAGKSSVSAPLAFHAVSVVAPPHAADVVYLQWAANYSSCNFCLMNVTVHCQGSAPH